MKITILTTTTNNVPPIVDPLTALGHKLHTITYDTMTASEQENDLFNRVVKSNPDWVLYVGALPGHHYSPVPTTPQLARIGEKYKLVHLCFDGAEPLWWPVLEDFYENGRFALQINIDGTRIGPIGERGLTTLCPVNPDNYFNPPWTERCIKMGFRGGVHGGRNEILKPLADKGYMTFSPRNLNDTHLHYAKFLAMCKMVLNVAVSGGPTAKLHVKARTLEAGSAGCLLLETKDSPLNNWFDAGTDYLEYAFFEGAIIQADWALGHEQEAEEMAQRFRSKIIERHSPKVFWSQVMERLGYGKAIHPVKEVPFMNWRTHQHRRPIATGSSAHQPVLIQSIKRTNFVSYDNRVYLVPQGLGPLDLSDPAHRVRDGIRDFATFDEAHSALNGT